MFGRIGRLFAFKLSLVVSFILLLGCASGPEPKTDPAPPGASQAPTAVKPVDSSVEARLVRSEEARKWPHLQRHIGQLLLLNRNLQILIPAAPPLSQQQADFALISKVYRLKGKEWEALPYLPNLAIHLETKSGEPLQLIGQDIVQEADGPRIVAFFRQNKSGSEDARLSYQLAADKGRIDLRVQSQNPNLRYRLALAKGLSEDYPIPLNGSAAAGISSVLLPEALSIIGYRPFAYAQTESGHSLSADSGHPGFVILLSREALLEQAEMLNLLAPCYAAKDCKIPPLTLPAKTGMDWKLEAPRLKKGEQAIWQSALLYDKQGSFRALIPIREGEKLDLPLDASAPANWDLLVRDEQGALQRLSLPDKPQTPVRLPKIKKGWLVLKADRDRARYVEIKASAEQNGRSLLAWISEDKTYLVSPNTLLRSRWPYTLSLPSGDYSLRIYDGFRIVCEQRLTIFQGRKTTFECNEPPLVPSFSVRASISVDRAALPEALLQASGVSVITSSEANRSKGLTEIPVLAAYDSELGLSIRAFPATKALEAGWNGLVRNNPERSTLQFFADYVRTHGKGASLVLDCPPPGFQIAEYQWIAQSIKPDVLEVFGCGEVAHSKELLDTASRLQQKSETPLRLAAASFNHSLYGTRVPAIYLPRYRHFSIAHKTTAIDPKLALEDLQKGNYTLGFRTELNLPAKVRRNDRSINLRIKSSDPVPRKLIIRILDQDDRLSEIEKTQDARQASLDVPLILKPSSRFLRVEVLGRDQAEEPFFTLATSNFFRLDDGP